MQLIQTSQLSLIVYLISQNKHHRTLETKPEPQKQDYRTRITETELQNQNRRICIKRTLDINAFSMTVDIMKITKYVLNSEFENNAFQSTFEIIYNKSFLR